MAAFPGEAPNPSACIFPDLQEAHTHPCLRLGLSIHQFLTSHTCSFLPLCCTPLSACYSERKRVFSTRKPTTTDGPSREQIGKKTSAATWAIDISMMTWIPSSCLRRTPLEEATGQSFWAESGKALKGNCKNPHDRRTRGSCQTASYSVAG